MPSGISVVGRFVRLGRRLVGVNDAIFSRLPKFAPTLGAAGLITASVVYGLILSKQGWPLVEGITVGAGFKLEKIEIVGFQETKVKEVLGQIGVREGQSLLLIDVDEARARVAQVPWVESVTLRKLYPGRLVVNMTERQPYALWQVKGEVSIIDATGHIITALDSQTHAMLPLVVGDGAAERASEAVALMDSQPELRGRVRAAVLVAERRWNLITIDGVEIRLPEAGALAAYARVAELDRSKQVLARDIVAIDMRVPDRVSLKLSDTAAEARRKAIEARRTKKGTDA
ncbi:MAG: FtsQ-type POTRA domain-containing protein [Hyphomicrobiaceae bacterium]|nr:FtsQ-type POTRA domain-containing protein [Hyphomicrobiaceae bacterium]